MRFPSPRVPKNYFKWSMRNRQRFADWIWNPWWKIKEFFEKRLTRKGLSDWWEATKFSFEVLRMIRKDRENGGETMAGENEKKCDCPEDEQWAPYLEALDVLREAHLNLMREFWKMEQDATWLSASMHAVHTGMFNMERKFIEIATGSMEGGNGSSGKRDA